MRKQLLYRNTMPIEHCTSVEKSKAIETLSRYIHQIPTQLPHADGTRDHTLKEKEISIMRVSM